MVHPLGPPNHRRHAAVAQQVVDGAAHAVGVGARPAVLRGRQKEGEENWQGRGETRREGGA